ncbi:MAG: arginine--tRNA ligase [Alphaproteobacteria bacterium CG_4_9_14_3_um_filter_47_13]|nr:MAG: arginine--tRNA ligase [Alphaproteobacteria bacterium CG_4_9_14_3_um_filter_47_13]
MTSLTEKLSILTGKAFTTCNLPAEYGTVRISDRPDLAQFQCNGAMGAAKAAKKNPREIADNIVRHLKEYGIFSKIEIAGPGFINFDITDDYLTAHLSEIMQNSRLGIEKYAAGETVIVDYVGPNVAKAMHVGHLRPTIIGDCIKRILAFSGYNALGDVHIGDWGLQMGQVISAFAQRHPEWSYFNPNFQGEYPEQPPFNYSELEEIYPQASAACKADPSQLEKAQQATKEFQGGRAGYWALGQQFTTLSKAHIKQNMDSVGVKFEIWKGEADAASLIPVVEKDLREKNIFEESQGALVIPIAKNSDNKEMPPLMYYKSDGATTYGTTDLVTLYDRVESYGAALAKIVYVVDKRQNLHFEQVFRAARKAGYVQEAPELVHIGFGTLNGADGKPFKTREGGIMRFDQLVTMAKDKALQRLEEANLAGDLDDARKQDIAHKVGVAAIKFADLSNQPHVDYIFDMERMVNFEGKTGPYILYQAVRIQSLLRKAEEQNFKISGEAVITISDQDRPLALLLTEMPDAFDAALRHYMPHHLCDYAYRLAAGFSSFYGNCHILSESDEARKASRLALCALTCRQLALVLGWLGIDIPERM